MSAFQFRLDFFRLFYLLLGLCLRSLRQHYITSYILDVGEGVINFEQLIYEGFRVSLIVCLTIVTKIMIATFRPCTAVRRDQHLCDGRETNNQNETLYTHYSR